MELNRALTKMTNFGRIGENKRLVKINAHKSASIKSDSFPCFGFATCKARGVEETTAT